jgi:hypothetical protein
MQVTVQIIRNCIYLFSLVFYTTTPVTEVKPLHQRQYIHSHILVLYGVTIPAIWDYPISALYAYYAAIPIIAKRVQLVLCHENFPLPRCPQRFYLGRCVPCILCLLDDASLTDVSLTDVCRPWTTYRRLKITTNRRNFGNPNFAYLTPASGPTLTVPTIPFPT